MVPGDDVVILLLWCGGSVVVGAVVCVVAGAVVCAVAGDDVGVGVGAAVDVVLLFLASPLWLQNSK